MLDFLSPLLADPVLLARIQFAFTISFHIVFPAFTIGLASYLAVLEYLWLRTDKPVYKELYQFWMKIFAIAFGLGVVSGVVMSYQFGTNWSRFSDHVGSVIGPLLGYEVLTAFFLEASFLGVMLFGWGRVSKKMHFTSTCIVAVGTMVSAFWILSANSWMQTPQGFEMAADGRLIPTNWIEIIFNPSFPYRFAHMLMAAYLSTAFVVGGVGAYYLFRKIHIAHAKIMLTMAMGMAIVMAPAQLMVGHSHGKNTLEYQPAKIAAMEGNWETGPEIGLSLLGWVDEENEVTHHWLYIPKMASLVVTGSTDGVVPGLKDWPKSERPPVNWVYWCFRIMVGIGMMMILTGIIALFLHWRGKLYDTHWFQLWCMGMMPTGFIAILAGWFVTEIGRQPYLVYGVYKTSEGISPVLSQHVALSLLAFIVIYTLAFGAGSYYILRLIGKGPEKKMSTPDTVFTGPAHGIPTANTKKDK